MQKGTQLLNQTRMELIFIMVAKCNWSQAVNDANLKPMGLCNVPKELKI